MLIVLNCRIFAGLAFIGLIAGIASIASAQAPTVDSTDDSAFVQADDEPLMSIEDEEEDEAAAALAAEAIAIEQANAVIAEVTALFNQLSDPSFNNREIATAMLIQRGEPVIALLKDLQRSTNDPEVLARSTVVIDSLEKNGLPQRVDNFLKHPGDVELHQFWGWPAFAEIVGNSRSSRRVFLMLLEEYPVLCNERLQVTSQLQSVAKDIRANISFKRIQFEPTSVADAIALQFLMLMMKSNTPAEVESQTVFLTSTAPYSSHLNDPRVSKPLKKLTGAWLETVQRSPLRPLLISLDFAIPEGRQLAMRVLQDNSISQEDYILATQIMMTNGGEECLPVLETWLTDERILFEIDIVQDGRPQNQSQRFQDLALAACVAIRGLKMTDYFPTAKPHLLRGYLQTSLVFIQDTSIDQRASAFERYANRDQSASGSPAQSN